MSDEQMKLFKKGVQYEQFEEYVRQGFVVIPLTDKEVEGLTVKQRASLPLLKVGDDVFHIQKRRKEW
jgi:hypothetical protein